MSKPMIGLVGLGTMGRNLALNLRDHGVNVVGFDLDPAHRDTFRAARAGQAVESMDWLPTALPSPRTILLLVPAGEAVDRLMGELEDVLTPGDIVADGGNSHFRDTERRAAAWEGQHLNWVGLGISGGEKGARNGPAIMAGGHAGALDRIEKMLRPVVAAGKAGPCFGRFGTGGSGHFVKMVHNGIEYAEMQLIAEIALLLRQGLGWSAPQASEWFSAQAAGPFGSYLMEITATILRRCDEESGQPLVDLVRDEAEQKGTGHWALTTASELGVAVPTIAEAVHARLLSSDRAGRGAMVRAKPSGTTLNVSADQLADALLAGRLSAFAQGFALLTAGGRAFGWSLDPAEAARVWQGGCIIRTHLLPLMAEAVDSPEGRANLLASTQISDLLVPRRRSWRTVVAGAALAGIPLPAMSSSLAYSEGLVSEVLWTGLVQAQRDCFGAHGFDRRDRPGRFHVDWDTSR